MMRFESKFGFHTIRPPCNASDIDAFEQTLPAGGKLPVDYQAFLLEWNGGHFKPFFMIAFPFQDAEFEDDYGLVAELYGLFDAENELDLRRSSLGYGFRDAVPISYNSIGSYGSFSQLCLAVCGSDAGWIYYWQPGEPWPEEPEPTTRCLRPVAASFSEFWELLFETSE